MFDSQSNNTSRTHSGECTTQWQMPSRGRDSSRATGSCTRGFSINFRKYGGFMMWTFLQHGTTDSSLVISASEQTQKQRQWMLWLSASQPLKPYAFPPFALIGRCLWKLDQEQVKELVLIVPVWHNQTWFPTLLTKLIGLPILLPDFRSSQIQRETHTH